VKPTTRILSEQQGRYQWGERDCLSTAALLVRDATGKRLPIKGWQRTSEARAVVKAVQQYGSVEAGHAAVLEKVGYIPLLAEHEAFKQAIKNYGKGEDTLARLRAPEIQPGDILTIATPVVFDEGPADVDHGVATLGFVADTYEVYTWAPNGLRVCSPEIIEIFRCHKR